MALASSRSAPSLTTDLSRRHSGSTEGSRYPSQGHIVLAMRSPILLLLLAVPLSAHNGAVAIAVPVEGIVVDRDLS